MTMCEPLPLADLLPMELQLTQSAQDFHAKTLAARENVRALLVNAAASGVTPPVLLANYDRDSCSWKTSQACLILGWETFSETWPRSGMMQNGIAYRLQPLVPSMAATAFGLWLTPTANEDAAGRAGANMQKMLGNHPAIRGAGDGTLNPAWVEWLMGFDTAHTDCAPSETQ